MAVPFRRTSKTKKRMRRTHLKLSATGLVKCSNCGALIKSHNVCPKCGYYDGKLVVSKKSKKAEEEVEAVKETKTSKKAKKVTEVKEAPVVEEVEAKEVKKAPAKKAAAKKSTSTKKEQDK